MAEYYIYIMNSPSHTIYTGITNNLERRVYEHKQGATAGFTKRYGCTTLVYYEGTSDVTSAITREKQIKGWLRSRNIALIEAGNPTWNDLSFGWYG